MSNLSPQHDNSTTVAAQQTSEQKISSDQSSVSSVLSSSKLTSGTGLHRIFRVLKKTALYVLLPIILLFMLLLLAVTTPTGIRFLFSMVSALVPNVEIKGVSGDWKNLKIDEVSVTPEGVLVSVKGIELGFDIDCLLQREVCVEYLNVARTQVDIDTHKLPEDTEPTRIEPLFISTPIPIYLKSAKLNNSTVNVNDLAISLDQISLHGDWIGKKIQLPKVVADTFLLHIPMSNDDDKTQSKADANASQALNSSVELSPNQRSDQQLDPLSVQLQKQFIEIPKQIKAIFDQPILASLPRVILPMDFALEDFSANSMDLNIGTLGIKLTEPTLQAESQEAKVNLQQLNTHIVLCFDALCGDFIVDIAPSMVDMQDDWPLQLDAEINLPRSIYQTERFGLPLAEHRVKLNSKGALLNNLNTEFNLSGPLFQSRLLTTLNLNQPYLPMSAEFETRGISWPAEDITFQPSAPSTESQESLKTDESERSNRTEIDAANYVTTDIPAYISKNTYQLDATRLAIKGDLKQYLLQFDTQFSVPQWPAGHLSTEANIGLNGLEVTSFQYDELNAKKNTSAGSDISLSSSVSPVSSSFGRAKSIALNGKLDWLNGLSWMLSTQFDDLQFSEIIPELSIEASGRFKTEGCFGMPDKTTTDQNTVTEAWQVSLNEVDVSGKINQFPFVIAGDIQGNSNGIWSIPAFSAQIGKNTLSIQGELNQSWLLDAKIDAPDLAGILPSLKGQLSGKINLSGDLNSPNLEVMLNAKQFGWESFVVKSLSLESNLKSADEISGKLALNAVGFKQAALDIETLKLDLNGSETKHQLTLKTTGKPVALDLALAGEFDRERLAWVGTVNRTQINTPIGDVSLNRDLNIVLEPNRLEMSAHCWAHQYAELCVTQPILLGEKGQIDLELKKLDLAMLREFLPSETQLTGQFTGKSTLNWDQNELPSGNLSLIGNNLAVIQHIDDADVPIRFDVANIKAEVANNQLKAETLISLANNGNLQSNLTINDLNQRRTLAGNVSLQNIDLKLLQPLFAQNEKITGAINSQLSLSGQLDSPMVNGQFNLSDLQVISFRIPFDISDSNLNIAFNGQRSTLQGQIITPDGVMHLKGNADWRVLNNWQANLDAQSDRLRINLPPLAQIDLSPDLSFDANKERLILKGNVDIPWGRITVDQLPESVVEVSRDEVLLDSNLQPIEQAAPAIPVRTNLQIRVGKDVQLNAFGLESFLRGDLQVTQNELGLALNGEINTYQGRFRAYGQDLILQKGIIAFAGAPDRPRLNIEAIRNPENMSNDVTAGIRVTGFSDDPRIELFSVPAMAQEEILSYILRGQGLDAAGADSSLMTSMLIGVGTAQSGRLIGRIGETFGVQNLTLDTQGSGDKSQVVVSGDIFDGLQVRYGVGIFDSLATLTLRYQLMPRLYLEAVSGLDQAIDILYQFEFN